MSYIIAIDVGIKNLGLCIFDFRTAKVVEWQNVSLVSSGRYVPSNNVQYVRDFVRRYERYFDDAFQVVIERQMRCNMRIVESVVHALFYDRCIIVSARRQVALRSEHEELPDEQTEGRGLGERVYRAEPTSV